MNSKLNKYSFLAFFWLNTFRTHRQKYQKWIEIINSEFGTVNIAVCHSFLVVLTISSRKEN